MKRIGLKQQIGAGVDVMTVDGRSPHQQISESVAMVQDLLADQTLLLRELVRELSDFDIHLRAYRELEPQHQEWLRKRYLKTIFALVTRSPVLSRGCCKKPSTTRTSLQSR